MAKSRIGSLCSGYGGLDMAVQDVLDSSVVWHCQYDPDDKHQYAARILQHHWPEVPNHGDITAVDWAAVEPIDILTAGFPCQDLSYAGRGAGIRGDILIPAGEMGCGCQWADHNPLTCDAASPSGLVPSRLDKEEAAQAAAELNKRDLTDPAGPPPEHYLKGTRSGLWYAVADAISALRPGLVILENVRAIVARRPGLDIVIGSLTDLGYNAEWLCLPASDTGAPHERFRWFCLACPADSQGQGLEGARVRGRLAERGGAAADSDDQREHRRGRLGGQPERHVAGSDRDAPHADGDAPGHDRELPARRDAVQQRVRDDAAGRRPAASDAPSLGAGEPADKTLSDSAGGQARPVPGGGDERVELWRQYWPAVHRWERILGRPAPSPVDDRGRLAAPFVEWMMGLPQGHVCDVPAPDGMTAAGLRNARLKALGNGVVRQQAAYALRLLLERMGQEVAA